MNKLKTYIGILSHDLFQVSLVTYLILLLLETIKTGFVSFFFDLNILMWLCLASGIIMVLTYSKQESITSVEIGKRVWHRFFNLMKGRVGKNSNFQFLFKEIRARDLIDSNLHFSYKDWLDYLRERDTKNRAQNDPSFLLREISLSRIIDRDWIHFSQRIQTRAKITERDIYYIFLMSLGGGALIFYKTQQLGKISIVVAVLGFILILLLSYLIFTEEN